MLINHNMQRERKGPMMMAAGVMCKCIMWNTKILDLCSIILHFAGGMRFALRNECRFCYNGYYLEFPGSACIFKSKS